jgi:hypothetical protein
MQRALMLGLVAIVLGGSWPYFERMLDANERPRLLAGIALVEQGSVRIDGGNARGLALGPDVARADDGTLVPNKPPGATLVASVAWLLLEGRDALTGAGIDRRSYTLLARALGGLLPTLLLAFVLWRRERADGVGTEQVDFAVIAWLLATPAWAYSKLLFGHSLAAALLGGGLLALTPRDRELGHARAALAGLLCASAIVVEYTAVFAGPAIAIWLIVRERKRWTVIAAAIAGAVPPIVGLAIYHHAVFGSPWTTGYHRAAHQEFAAIHDRGLLGLQWPSLDSAWEHLLSPWGGAFVWCPLALLGLLAGAWAARRASDPDARARHALFAAVGLSMFVVLLGLEQGGGWRVGPRYFVLALPLAVPGLIVLTRELGSRGQRRGLGFALVLGLFGSSLVSQFLAANWFPHLIPHGNPLGDLLWPLALAGMRVHGLPAWVIAIATVMLVGVVLVRLGRASEHGRGPWIGGLAIALVILAAQSFGPISEPDAEVELAAIRAIAEPDADGRSPISTLLRPAD